LIITAFSAVLLAWDCAFLALLLARLRALAARTTCELLCTRLLQGTFHGDERWSVVTEILVTGGAVLTDVPVILNALLASLIITAFSAVLLAWDCAFLALLLARLRALAARTTCELLCTRLLQGTFHGNQRWSVVTEILVAGIAVLTDVPVILNALLASIIITAFSAELLAWDCTFLALLLARLSTLAARATSVLATEGQLLGKKGWAVRIMCLMALRTRTTLVNVVLNTFLASILGSIFT